MSFQLNFVSKLKDKKSNAILSEIEKFIQQDFQYIETQEELSKNIQDFITKILFDFVKIWDIPLTSKNSQYGEIIDNIENLVIKSLYNKLFCTTKLEKEEDYKFDRLIKMYEFITPKHLDIEKIIIDPITLELSINKLNEINNYRSPKDKSATIINFCRILSYMVSANQKNTATGADEVYPVIVYALLKGNINKIKSNLNFIKLFRHKSRLESEEEYYFTTLFSAVDFIESLNHSKLNIDEEEFKKLCEENMKKEMVRHQTIIKIPKISNIIVNEENSEENNLLTMLNKSANNINESIELFDIKSNNSIPKNKVNISNVSTYRRKSSINISDGLLNINLDSLVNQYYSCDFKDLNINKIEKLYSDFKIALKLIEDYKINNVYPNDLKRNISEINDNKKTDFSSEVKNQISLNDANVNLIDI